MKRLFLELGGKSATIVLDDADLALALHDRHRALHARRPGLRDPDPDAAAAVALRRGRRDPQGRSTRASPPGDPQDPATLCGPVISAKQRDRILGYIREGHRRGRQRSLVGGAEAPAGLDKGFFVKPTLFVDVDNSMTIAQEEIFGPVLVVIPYDDEDDAVRIANDSPYGLAGNVMSGSLERSLAVARRLRAGFIGLNGGAGYGADVPFGGYKASGVGRQNGIAGFDQYIEVKSVAYPASPEGDACSAAVRRSRGLRGVRRRRLGRRARPVHRAGPAAARGSRAAPRHVGDAAARRASPSSWCTATKRSRRCCGTTRRSRPRSSSSSSAMSWAST